MYNPRVISRALSEQYRTIQPSGNGTSTDFYSSNSTILQFSEVLIYRTNPFPTNNERMRPVVFLFPTVFKFKPGSVSWNESYMYFFYTFFETFVKYNTKDNPNHIELCINEFLSSHEHHAIINMITICKD